MPKQYKDNLELDREVFFIVNQHRGEENAILRWDLVGMVFGADVVILPMRTNNNPYDRRVRDSIERWRAAGQHLANAGDGNGYYMANTREEYERFKQYYLGAAYRKLQVVYVMDEVANERWGRQPKPSSPMQTSMFG